MPRRTDIHSILIIGSGPIVIGQGCEFDYSGVQACRALREEGYRIVLINSNPATIMTDPQFADATYIEPITPEAVEKILEREKQQGTPVDALLPTLGGQTGLNTGMACFDSGLLTRYGVQMIGADRDAIHKGEDRQVFKDLMLSIGLNVPRSGVVHNMDDARKVLTDIGLPLIIRPAFTLGGTGGGIAYNVDEFEEIVTRGLDASPVTEVLIEQSVIGYKEYEMEVVRDRNDNCIIICSIENIDAMGVHTGDSITVAPIQTLSDKEFQKMRDASFAVIRAVGVETGGSNIQFGINPDTGEMVVIEMNPRVSRSSALASKATGYPIAKIAAKLAVGYTLDELPNPITTRKRGTSNSAAFPATQVAHPDRPDGSSERADAQESGVGGQTGDTGALRRDSDERPSDSGVRLSDFGERPSDSHARLSDSGARPSNAGEHGNDFGVGGSDAGVGPNGVGALRSPVISGFHGLVSQAVSDDPEARPGGPDRGTPSGAATVEVREDYELYTSACFEPSIDYVVVKIPRWTFEKFPDADETLTTQMKSVGEAMAIGRTFKEAWQKAIRSMEVKRSGFGLDKLDASLAASGSVGLQPTPRGLKTHTTPEWPIDAGTLRRKLSVPGPERMYFVRYALKMGWTIDLIHELTHIDPWFLAQFKELTDFETRVLDLEKTEPKFTDPACSASEKSADYANLLVEGKQLGYSDVQFATAWSDTPDQTRRVREWFTKPVYKLVDTCAAEFEAATPYYYSTYETPFVGSALADHDGPNGERSAGADPTAEDEIRLSDKPKILIIGGGPNRIGQGIEFDYCCVQAAFAMREMGLESVMINSNPETVSTDYDTSDLLFFEPLTHEDVLNVCERLNGGPFVGSALADRNGDGDDRSARADPTNLVKGVIVQFGGQTPLNLARGLHDAGVPIIGTSIDMLEAAGDREKFRTLVEQVGLKQPENGIARSVEDAKRIAADIGYPVLVRPSFVLGGRAMEIVGDEQQLNHYMAIAVKAEGQNPILVDKFLDHAVECDVDCIADYDEHGVGRSVICGVMEHIEEAGIHSGDSACALPPYSFSPELIAALKENTHKLAKALKVCGLMNVQYAVKDGEIYLIEVNPRASRTIPFVGKATGVPWAKLAAKVMAGMTLDELGVQELPPPKHVSVKEVVFPFSKFPGVDIILGPEMRSTGEVMGIDTTFAKAFAKSQIAAGSPLPTKGTVYMSVNDADKAEIAPIAKQFADCGFKLIATGGTLDVLTKAGIQAERVNKLGEGRPNLGDLLKNGQIQLIVNTPTKKGPGTDEGKLRSMAVSNRVTILTTLTAARAAALAVADLQKEGWSVRPLQAYFEAGTPA